MSGSDGDSSDRAPGASSLFGGSPFSRSRPRLPLPLTSPSHPETSGFPAEAPLDQEFTSPRDVENDAEPIPPEPEPVYSSPFAANEAAFPAAQTYRDLSVEDQGQAYAPDVGVYSESPHDSYSEAYPENHPEVYPGSHPETYSETYPEAEFEYASPYDEPQPGDAPITESPAADHHHSDDPNPAYPNPAYPNPAYPNPAYPNADYPVADYSELALDELVAPAPIAPPGAASNPPARYARAAQPAYAAQPIDDKLTPGEGRLTALGLAKSFGGRKVLKNVSLSLERGEVVGLLGPNGAGKTTSFYMVCGLLKPDSGKVLIDGRDVTNKAVYQRARRGLGYLPQEASIFRGLTVEKNILSILETRYRRRRDRREKLEELLDEFSIQHIRKSPALALSGGERRRVEIARALAADPSFVLLDEPFAGIDPIAVGDIRNLVSQLKNRGIGILITDHNVRETLGVVERAYIIYAGEVLKHGYPADIINDQTVRDVYLGEQFSL